MYDNVVGNVVDDEDDDDDEDDEEEENVADNYVEDDDAEEDEVEDDDVEENNCEDDNAEDEVEDFKVEDDDVEKEKDDDVEGDNIEGDDLTKKDNNGARTNIMSTDQDFAWVPQELLTRTCTKSYKDVLRGFHQDLQKIFLQGRAQDNLTSISRRSCKDWFKSAQGPLERKS